MEGKEPSPLPRDDVHSSKRTHPEHIDSSGSRVKLQIVPDECIFEKDVMHTETVWFVGDANGNCQINTHLFRSCALCIINCNVEANHSIDTGRVLTYSTLTHSREWYSDPVECRSARRANHGWNWLCGYSRFPTIPIVPFIYGVIISIRCGDMDP